LRALERAAHSLEQDGMLKDAKVEAVYPGDETAQFKGAFVVKFHSNAPNAVAVRLNALPGVRNAYVAPARMALASR
jgi:hypothetical protein